MNAIKKIAALIFLFPIFCIAQKDKIPSKDTIYVKYENKEDTKKWPGKFEGSYNEDCGFFFNVVDNHKKSMVLFYPYTNSADTLSIEAIKNYHFSNLKEIDKKRYSWIFERNGFPRDRNGVFKTYLVEEISETQIVIYPVIWRNEGVVF